MYLDIRIEFDVEKDFDDEPPRLKPKIVIPWKTDIGEASMLDDLSESLHQSDYGQIDISQALLCAMDGVTVTNVER